MREAQTPLIGVPCYSAERAGGRRPIYGNNQTYIRALIDAGAAPLMIPPGLDLPALEMLCARLDGLLLTGGADIDPARYGEERLPLCGEPEPERDELELTLTHLALERDLPTLGICRGMQTLNVACGGTLYQDLASQRPQVAQHEHGDSPRSYLAHTIAIERGSRLGEILGVAEARVNSLHHQAVKQPGAGAQVVAWAADGVAEGMEAPDHRFVVAVQYHPEELVATDALSRRLFAAFAQACREG